MDRRRARGARRRRARAQAACLLLNNVADSNAYGVVVMSGPGSRLEGNNLTRNVVGMNVIGTGNLVVRNECFANDTAYWISAGNSWGPYVNVSAGGTLGETNPWANFRD